MPIRCEIVSQERLVFEGEADLVIVPGANGVMGILPNHAPLLSTLQLGVIKVRRQEEEYVFTVTGGIVDVQPNLIIVMADTAESVQEIDVARAEAARERAEELLSRGLPPDNDAYLAIEAALNRSKLRIEAVKRYRGLSKAAANTARPSSAQKES